MKTNSIINTSKIRTNKNVFYAISLIAIFAISILMAFAPLASAQVGITQPRPTAGYIDVAPNLVGVGQQATVNVWVLPWPEDYALNSWYGGPNGSGFGGITVTFTKPDGTKDTFTPTDAINTYPAGYTDGLGTLYFYYAPNEAGNWSVTMSMPAQNFTDTSGTVQWMTCTSQPAYFAVTTEAQNAGLLNGWPYSPLPNANTYWTYPISPNNREWSAIAGNWLAGSVYAGSGYQPYGPAPNTGHILWDIPYLPDGIVGGSTGSLSYGPGSGTGTETASLIIIDGNLYTNTVNMINGINSPSSFECIALTTGKVLWTAPGTISGAVDLPGNVYNQANLGTGVTLTGSAGNDIFPYLFQNAGTTWNYYSVSTGALSLSITNVTATSFTFVNDTPLAFGYTSTYYTAPSTIWEWNMSKVVPNLVLVGVAPSYDWKSGLMWQQKVNTPKFILAGMDTDIFDGEGISADASTMMFYSTRGGNVAVGYSTTDGHSLWNDTFAYSMAGGSILAGTNDFTTLDFSGGSMTVRLYSILTGALLWTNTQVGTVPWNTETVNAGTTDGTNVYFVNPDGTVTALSLATGATVWQSTPIPSNEYVENNVPYWIGTVVIAGGNLYLYGGGTTSYEQNPIPRFAMLVCLNATTGATVFTLNGGIAPGAEVSGYLFGTSVYSGYIYCLGKGQTSTSVSAPTTAVTEGTTALIQGNVLDQSPAQPGTPAVSDASISEQMDYLHMQNATLLNSPPHEMGVTVTLTAVDPNNNAVTIGSTTTDSAGNYGYTFIPNTSGMYTITATFAGTGSYWPSSSETKLAVTATPTTTSGTSTTTSTSTGISDTTLYAAVAVIIIVVIIATIAIILSVRKRP